MAKYLSLTKPAGVAILLMICYSAITLGQDTACKVADPTGTPLNIRKSPNGRVVSMLQNGAYVQVGKLDTDSRGRTWVNVSDSKYKELGWVLRSSISCGGSRSTDKAKPGDPVGLLAAIALEHPSSPDNPFSLVKIGSDQYLIQDGKVVKTRKAKIVGGMCGKYASIWMESSDLEMNEKSEGEGSIWALENGTWRLIIHSSAGDWECSNVRALPMAVRRCLGAARCN